MIHISHVIELVLDPRGYIQQLKRVLKPDGYLAIGTPNMSSNLYRMHRWTKLLRLQLPDVIDGLEHTFIFPKRLLADLCLEEGLAIEDRYTHVLREKIGNLLRYKTPLKKKLNRLVQNFFQVNQWIVCRKN
ncbi:methyltransferase domain-containing protein [Algoriphagus terrigena]|uniref:methyltransferase domain-containing protein n=1 Tax=Algoriphagus terrigena TaxID=344884 RepID=UPI0004164139|nr:methyltransferase domain-containing protein [Algoriphagus terrigena]